LPAGATPLTQLRLPVLSNQPSRVDEHQRESIARDLRALIGGAVRFGRHDRMLYATDASIYQVEPIGVVEPLTIDEAVEVIRYAAHAGIPLLPRGGGTALAGQSVNHAIVIDFSRNCRRVLEIDGDRRTARVEPGVVLDQLNQALLPHGLMFGPDVATSSHACLGGMIGNNSAGAYSILYGRTVEHLIGLDVALASGDRMRFDEGAAHRDPRVMRLTRAVAEAVAPLQSEIRRRFPKIKRHVDGYNLDLLLDQLERSTPGTFDRVNLAHLICGSEGTLATTLAATLRLTERPRSRGLAIVGFASVAEALAALATILETTPAAVELVDDVIIEVAKANAEYRRYVELMPQPASGQLGAVLYVEYFAGDRAGVELKMAELQERMALQSMQIHYDASAMAKAWKLRKAGEPLLHGIPGLRKPVTFVEDTAVDPSRLPGFVEEFRAIVARHGTTAAYYAHASVGCLHIRPMVHLKDPADLATMESIASEVAELVARYEGALSGEHGDGRVRSPFLERYFGRELCEGFRAIKRIFDPANLMNPGNITDPGGISDRLRVKPDDSFVEVPQTNTYFRYAKEHGFESAVEMCNGAGLCRRVYVGGVMCPSYRALLDERHATRGRGNALRLAISGQLGDGEPGRRWSDPETIETLDLCLSCKACKTECPSNVDIAKLKAEYTAQRFDHRGRVPLSTLLFGHVRTMNRLGSLTPGLANAVNRSAPGKWLAHKLLGVHPKRHIPRFERSLYRWFRNRRSAAASDAPVVILFPDCFTVYNEPRIGKAAVEVLERCGYRVVLPNLGCCGRSLISNGMLAESITTCRATATALDEVCREHNAVAIVGCEPSCVSAIKDEWLDLRLGLDDRMLQRLAAMAWMVEHFVEADWDRHPARPRVAPPDGSVILHGHCHQKALWGVETSAAGLRRVCGEHLSVLDSGCCGMAGAFGYAAHRYDLSMQIGELSLFPPLRAKPEAIVAAPGTSCRHQIFDALGREALHPIEIIARQIAP
jgi:FAD/FMN-containing dehydrogenase/Fe-S oxidoreductase